MTVRRLLVTGGSGFIGTNLVAAALARGTDVASLDRVPPRAGEHAPVWSEVDLLDRVALAAAVAEAAPSHVVHLAARTDLRGPSAGEYAVNTTGTANLLAAIDAVGGVERTVVASSLLVCRNGYVPSSDTDYCPTTAYGESKREMEELVRAWQPRGSWVLVRPTSIWGPWLGEPYRPFVERVRAGRYVHPGREPVPKALGFVGNTVAQIDALLGASVAGRTFYLTDSPGYSVHEWADALADAAGRRPLRHVPVGLWRVAGRVGDVLQRVRIWAEPPLTSFRVGNMLTASAFDTAELDELTGPLPFDLAAGAAETLRWLEGQA